MTRAAGGPPPRPARPGAAAEPGWANPANALTLLRVVLVPVIAALCAAGGRGARWWAFGIFVVAALSDTADGWVARRWLGSTRWGQMADPAADKALIVGALVTLAWLGEVPWWAVAVVVVREVAVTAQRHLLLRRGVVMPASVFGKAKTVTQVLAVALYLAPGAPRGLAGAALAVAVAATVASGLEYVWRGRRLERAAPRAR